MIASDVNRDSTPNNDTYDTSSSSPITSLMAEPSGLSGIVSTTLTQLQAYTGQNFSHYQSTAAAPTPYGMDFWQALGDLLADMQQCRVRTAQLQFQANVLQQISDAVIAIDQDECITYLNAAAAAQYEVDPADVVGQPLSAVHQYEWRQLDDALLAYERLDVHGYWRGENRHIKRNGQVLHVESVVSLLRNQAGNKVGLLACIRNSNARKQAEATIQSGEARYRQLADAMPQLVWTANEDGIVDYFNIRIHDYDPAVWAGTYSFDWPRLLHPDDLGPTLAAWHQTVASKAHYTVEHRIRMADGSWRWHLTRANWVGEVDHGGRWYGTSTDIHERHQIENALRQQQQLMQAIVELAPAILYLQDLTSRESVFITKTAATTLGYTAEEFSALGADLLPTLMHPADQQALAEHFNRLQTAEDGAVYQFEYRMQHKNGAWRWFLSRDTIFQRTPDGKPLHIVGAAIETTEHKVAAERLHTNEARLQLGIQVAGLGIAEVDYTTNLIHLSPEAATLFGLPAETGAVPRATVHALFHPADRDEIYRRIHEALEPTGPGWFDMAHRIIRPDGQTRWLNVRKQIFFEPSVAGAGRPVRALLAVMDVTTNKQVEETLNFHASLLNYAYDAVIATDAEHHITAWNHGAAAMYGWSAAEVLSRQISEVTQSSLTPAERAEAVRQLTVYGRYQLEITTHHRDGTPILVEGQTVPMRDETGHIHGYMSISRDIRARKAVEQALRQSEERYRTLFETMDEGFCIVEMLFDEADHPCDYRFLEVNPAFVEFTGLVGAVGKTARDLVPDLEARWFEIYGKVALTGEPCRFTEGSTAMGRWFEVYAFRFGEPEHRRVALLFNNITERKQAEDAVRASAEELRYTIELNPQVPWTADPAGNIISFNQRWLTLTGLTKEAALDNGWTQAPHPDDRPAMLAAWTHAVQTGEPYDIEHRIRLADGQYRWMRSYAVPRRNEAGGIVRWYGSTEDIHERKLAEAALRASEAFSRTILESSPDCVKVLDAEGRLLQMNGPGLCLLEIDDFTLLLGQPWETLWPAASGSLIRRALTTARNGEQGRFQALCPTSKGALKWWDVIIAPVKVADGGVTHFVVASRDITEARSIEDALSRATSRFERAEQAANAFVFESDLSRGYVVRSPNFTQVTGYALDEVAPTVTGWLNLFHPDDLAGFHEHDWFANPLTTYSSEYRIRHKQGHYIWVKEHGLIERGPGGAPRAIIGTTLDITAQKVAEEALGQSEARFRQLADAMPQVVWTCQADGTMTYVNEQWVAYSGLPLAATLAQGMWPTLYPADLVANRAQWQRALERGEPYEGEVRLRRHDGVYRWFLERALPVRDETGRIQQWFGVSMDITDRKTAEEALTEREAFLRAITDAVPNLIGYIDRHKCYRFVNATYEQWFARPRAEIEGHTMTDLLETKVNTWRHHWERALAGETVFFEETFTYPDSITRTVMGSYIPDLDADGQVLGFYLYINDITARKQAEAAVVAREAELRVITDNIPGLVSYVDRAQHYRFVNAAYEEFYQQPRAKLLGQHVRAVMTEVAYHQVQPYLMRALHGETVQFEATLAYPNGPRTVWATYVPDIDALGVVQGFYALVTDISERKAVEEALRQSEETARQRLAELEAIYDTAPIGLCVLDHELRWLRINERLAEINGFPAAVHIGHSMDELLPDLVPALKPLLQQILESKQPVLNVELHGQTPAQPGVERTWLAHWFPLHDQVGTVIGINVVAEEITERKRQELHQQFLSNLWMHLRLLNDTDAILAKLASQVGSYLQVAGCRVNEIDLANAQFTLQKDWVANDAPWGPVPTPSVYSLAELASPAVLAELQTGRTVVIANTVTDPRTVVVSATYQSEQIHSFIGVPIFHQGEWRATVSVKGYRERQWRQDEIYLVETVASQLASLLERVRAEEAVRHLNVSLEERVRERTITLERTNQALTNSNRELEQFNYATAHDLRTPLRGVHNLVQWIVEDAASVLPPTSQRHLALLQGRVKRLEKMLDDMLAYSQIGRVSHTSEPVDTYALVHSLFELLAPPAGFRLETPVRLPTLMTQRSPLETILLNLLSNAIKHHHQPAGGQVQVTAQDLGEWVEFWISDNGPGIEPTYHERIFGMFQTLKPRDQVEGSGIGLALVKKTLENCGGTITVESHVSVGTTFRFTWPK